MSDKTKQFSIGNQNEDEISDIILTTYDALNEKGYNPISREDVVTIRREMKVEYDLPLREAYAELVAGFVGSAKEMIL